MKRHEDLRYPCLVAPIWDVSDEAGGAGGQVSRPAYQLAYNVPKTQFRVKTGDAGFRLHSFLLICHIWTLAVRLHPNASFQPRSDSLRSLLACLNSRRNHYSQELTLVQSISNSSKESQTLGLPFLCRPASRHHFRITILTSLNSSSVNLISSSASG
jgi:hypothetical protein